MVPIQRDGPATAKNRAARYIRVSRSDQRPALQADETVEFIDRRGWTLVDTFVDEGVSGTKDRRPGLDRLLAAARRRDFDILVVWRSDRLFRSLSNMVAALGELSALGIAFVSVTEPFDTTTPQGRLLLHLVAAFAEFERGVLVERTRAGIVSMSTLRDGTENTLFDGLPVPVPARCRPSGKRKWEGAARRVALGGCTPAPPRLPPTLCERPHSACRSSAVRCRRGGSRRQIGRRGLRP